MSERLARLPLGDAARAFAERLLARHPAWEPYVSAYEPAVPADRTPAGSLWVEVPSPADPEAALWLMLQDGEALVGLGYRAAEATFAWAPDERDDAYRSILALIDDIVCAEVVGVWTRHRFLWRTWESCEFLRAADVPANATRISAWPAAPVDGDIRPS